MVPGRMRSAGPKDADLRSNASATEGITKWIEYYSSVLDSEYIYTIWRIHVTIVNEASLMSQHQPLHNYKP